MIKSGCNETTLPQEYDAIMDINLRVPFILTQFFLEMLTETKGCIVNLSSDKGSKAEPGQIAYCMSKAGIEMLTKASAMELALAGVRVNAVAPSFVDTNFYRAAGMPEQDYDGLKLRAKANIPLQRIAQESEIAKAIIFLTSEQ